MILILWWWFLITKKKKKISHSNFINFKIFVLFCKQGANLDDTSNIFSSPEHPNNSVIRKNIVNGNGKCVFVVVVIVDNFIVF